MFLSLSLSLSLCNPIGIAIAIQGTSPQTQRQLWQLYPPPNAKSLSDFALAIRKVARSHSPSWGSTAISANLGCWFWFWFLCCVGEAWRLLRVPAGARECPPITWRGCASPSLPASSSAPASLSKRRVWRRLALVELGQVLFLFPPPPNKKKIDVDSAQFSA